MEHGVQAPSRAHEAVCIGDSRLALFEGDQSAYSDNSGSYRARTEQVMADGGRREGKAHGGVRVRAYEGKEGLDGGTVVAREMRAGAGQIVQEGGPGSSGSGFGALDAAGAAGGAGAGAITLGGVRSGCRLGECGRLRTFVRARRQFWQRWLWRRLSRGPSALRGGMGAVWQSGRERDMGRCVALREGKRHGELRGTPGGKRHGHSSALTG